MEDYTNVIKLYKLWHWMHHRCGNPKSTSWEVYGGRGITVSDEWKDFNAFAHWALPNYKPGLQLDRTDNDKGYSPNNCRWVSASINSKNRRTNRWVAAFGEKKVIIDWEADSRCSVSRTTLSRRLNEGWEPEKAITEPSTWENPKCPYGHDKPVIDNNKYGDCKECARLRASIYYYKNKNRSSLNADTG